MEGDDVNDKEHHHTRPILLAVVVNTTRAHKPFVVRFFSIMWNIVTHTGRVQSFLKAVN